MYLRRDLIRLIRAFFASVFARSVTTHDQRMAWYLVLATIPAALIGAALEGPITDNLGKPWQIAVLLALFGVLLYVVDKRASQRTPYDAMTRNQALAMGVAQALALAPGVSRSGATITKCAPVTHSKTSPHVGHGHGSVRMPYHSPSLVSTPSNSAISSSPQTVWSVWPGAVGVRVSARR